MGANYGECASIFNMNKYLLPSGRVKSEKSFGKNRGDNGTTVTVRCLCVRACVHVNGINIAPEA
jgi:hypothetical protein